MLWADTFYTGELFVYTGSDWVSMTGGGSGEGAVGDNNTEDAIPNGLVDKGLVREIDEDGDGYNGVSPQLQTSSQSASRRFFWRRETSQSRPWRSTTSRRPTGTCTLPSPAERALAASS